MTAAIGGAVALAVAAALGQAVQRYFPYAAGAELMTARTLVVVGLLAFFAGVSSGIVPVVHASRAGAERFLRTGHSLAASRSRWRTMLLSLQIAIALRRGDTAEHHSISRLAVIRMHARTSQWVMFIRGTRIEAFCSKVVRNVSHKNAACAAVVSMANRLDFRHFGPDVAATDFGYSSAGDAVG